MHHFKGGEMSKEEISYLEIEIRNKKERINFLKSKLKQEKHIEVGTLIRVWDDDEKNNKIASFYKFLSDGVHTRHNSCHSPVHWKNYELIAPAEINPEVKK